MFARPIHAQAFALLAALVLLSAYEMRTNTAVITGLNSDALAQTTNGTHTIMRTALAGKTTNVGGGWDINPDCTVRDMMTTHITQAPVHGTAAVVQRDDFPNYVAGNARSACNKTKIPGVFVDYTPAPGFTGSDLMVFEIIGANGTDNIWKVVITVK